MSAEMAASQTLDTEWLLPQNRYTFTEQDVIDFWDLHNDPGIAMVIHVDTRWFSAQRWVSLINQEIDGSKADFWGDGSLPLITTHSSKQKGADHLRQRVIGSPIIMVQSFYLVDYIMETCGDIPYFGRGKAEKIAAHFDSVEEVETASEEELAEVPNLGKDVLSKVYARIHEDDS